MTRAAPSYLKPRGGAPKGNHNRLKHGLWSAATRARHAHLRAVLDSSRQLLLEVEALIALRRRLGLPRSINTYVFTTEDGHGHCSVRTRIVYIGHDSRRMSKDAIAHARAMQPLFEEICVIWDREGFSSYRFAKAVAAALQTAAELSLRAAVGPIGEVAQRPLHPLQRRGDLLPAIRAHRRHHPHRHRACRERHRPTRRYSGDLPEPPPRTRQATQAGSRAPPLDSARGRRMLS